MADQSSKYTINYILVGVLVVAAFLIGSLYTKVTILEKGTVNQENSQAAGEQTAGKYKTFDEALSDFAKQVGIDGKKLVSCTNSGSKKAKVTADTKTGEGVGVSGTPAFFVNGRFLGGAYPFESFKEIIDKELAGEGSSTVEDYSESLQQAAQNGSFNPEPKGVELGGSPVRGDKNAKVTIVEFSDFQCPFCVRAHPTMKQVLKEYEGKVKLVYKHFPLTSIHPKAEKAAQASECAKDQGKFWEFHDKLFDNSTEWVNI
ncbi:hypothetical protein A2773_06840 [Candidatus Gottesmanbacteria bacterium RIFCSPHIGHO2_01_FULL_39_10]|uniref:Thioredoxin domain-containing protein n=1 Tax=Candidatus Gottesmanbacteria bacterium RIFCSPHIGHO2_01_FULL_39_10 TaxID=1798375 RepID=A0A1F5ZQR3_9BACT|nr:MAG: hypothetical protein A2773_06840 [Candidatus Gottesmanbacteria bacterium RIFCSPHIGHO2_01_FULL_39_10]